MSGGCVSEPGARRCTHPAARSARNGFGERGVQSRRLKPVGWGSGSLGVRTRACDAGKCVRRLAACVPLPGSSAHVSRCSGLRDHCPPSTPRRLGKWGVGQGAGGGLLRLAAPQLFPLMAAMTPLTLCAPGGPAPASRELRHAARGSRGSEARAAVSCGGAGALRASQCAFPSRGRTESVLPWRAGRAVLTRTIQLQDCSLALLGARSWRSEEGGMARGEGGCLGGDAHGHLREMSLNQLLTAPTGAITWCPFRTASGGAAQAGTARAGKGETPKSKKSRMERMFQKEKPTALRLLLFIFQISIPLGLPRLHLKSVLELGEGF